MLHASISSIDWDFANATTDHTTHSFHPYPAKFIPQIPEQLIQMYTRPGDVVLDPFSGSGTTLVEAVRLGRDAIGTDLNPLAVLISKVKTHPLTQQQLRFLDTFLFEVDLYLRQNYDVLHSLRKDVPPEKLAVFDFWFQPNVINECLGIKKMIWAVEDSAVREFLMVAFSSMLVTVSHQDSDTRYTRRDKGIKDYDTYKRFQSRVLDMSQKMAQSLTVLQGSCSVFHSSATDLKWLTPNSVQLIVTSPPYPNAFSYHLYHQNRMLWLDMDPYLFKKGEIGSHRKYSAKNGATADTFAEEMTACFSALRTALVPGGYFCLVVGDSIVRGELIRNDVLLTKVAVDAGLELVDQTHRNISAKRKAFNPVIGKIKQEHMLLFRKGH